MSHSTTTTTTTTTTATATASAAAAAYVTALVNRASFTFSATNKLFCYYLCRLGLWMLSSQT
jgi:hypothetical protein